MLEGRLLYRVCDPRRAAAEVVLTPETPPGIIEPTVSHLVEPLGSVRFYVDFHRAEDPAAAPPDAASSVGLKP